MAPKLPRKREQRGVDEQKTYPPDQSLRGNQLLTNYYCEQIPSERKSVVQNRAPRINIPEKVERHRSISPHLVRARRPMNDRSRTPTYRETHNSRQETVSPLLFQEHTLEDDLIHTRSTKIMAPFTSKIKEYSLDSCGLIKGL